MAENLNDEILFHLFFQKLYLYYLLKNSLNEVLQPGLLTEEVYIPTCENQIFHDAVSACTAKQLKYEKIGDGTVVRYQRPAAGYPIPKGNTIYLYMDETEPLLNTVPDVIGLTPSQAETKLKANRYNVRIKGEGQTVIEQSPLPGETYEAGIITTIYLG